MAAITLVAVVAVAWLARAAHADNVDKLIEQLDDSSDKIRLSAALNLTKLGDPRAIRGLAKALSNDSSKNVRSAAAVGLGQLVDAKTNPNDRKVAVAALTNAQSNDPSEFVKAQAERALGTIGAATPTPTPSGGGIYVNVAPMANDKGITDPKYPKLMSRTAERSLQKVAPNMATTWPTGLPTKQQLAQKGVQGFYVDGTLNTLDVTKTGGSAKVSCKVSMYLASFPEKSAFGFLNGNAAVTTGASDRDIALAGEDCVAAVVEDLITKKIVPTIKAKVGP
ncbi:MAG: HEAT repeat domain-containing protein [Deltaproteobacteria bacterium]|nr:HEAT repeat domain-containing protein [Deltaproteobacteria bacterium]MCW5805001.1 HEAT repeat domain-containing protein [Deltaproteobacteria bacterium]